METCPEVSFIDMPSGSSVVLPGWDGLVTVQSGNAWIPRGHLAIEMSCGQNPGRMATENYEKRTNDPLGIDVANTTFIFITPRKWPGKRQWVCERKEEGNWADVRVIDADDLVAWIEQAPSEREWFAGLIGKGLMGLGRSIVEDVNQHSNNLQSEVMAEIRDFRASVLATADSEGTQTALDPAHVKLEAKIDSARDSIRRGYVSAAKSQLQELRNKHGTLPPELDFRIVANLGICALAVDEINGACTLFEEAHSLQPENPRAIAYAALAAHLKEDRKKAVRLAIKARELDPQSSQATAILLLKYWETGRVEELDELIATEAWLAKDPHCGAIVASIRADQMRFNEAATICRSLTKANPDDFELQLALAACLLSWAQADRRAFQYTLDSESILNEAKAAATHAIEQLQETDLKGKFHNALAIRADAKSLLGEWAEAIHDFDRVLAEDSRHNEAAFNKGLLLARMGRMKEALPLFETVWNSGEIPHVDLPLADAYLASGDPSEAVKLLNGTVTLKRLEWIDIQRAEILSQAEKEAGVRDSVEEILNAALQRFPSNPRLLTLESTLCEIHGDAEGAEQSLLKALKHSDGSDHRQIELRLANLHYSHHRFARAAKLFEGIVNGVASHPLASTLLRCLIISKQLREALDWAREIKDESSGVSKLALAVEVEVLQIAGDVPAAVSCLLEICKFEDATAEDRLRLAEAQYRCGERGSAHETVHGITSLELINDPQLLMKLAQLKFLLGSTDFLNDAYMALRHGRDDPAVHKGYGGLFTACERSWTEPEEIGPGCAVLLRNESGQQWWNILEEGEEPHGPHDISSTSRLGAILSGQREGKTIVLRQDLEELSYRVEEVQSKFVRAFQETFEEFSTRFPGDMSLSRIEIKDDDFTKFYQIVEHADQSERNALRVYQEGKVPFVTFFPLLRKPFLDVWVRLTYEDSGLIAGDGTNEEAERAESLMRGAQDVVLGLVALLTVRALSISEHLRDRFSRIFVPQYVLDAIYDAVSEAEFTGQPAGFLGKSTEGYYTFNEATENSWSKRQEFLMSLRDLAESFERIPSYRVLEINDLDEMRSALTPVGVGAVFAGYEGMENGPVLISDDLALSKVAQSRSISVVNSEAVLRELHRTDVISEEAYSSYIEQLVLMNYRFVRVGPGDILRRLEAGDYLTTPGIRKMISTLDGPDCSLESAVSVATTVVSKLTGKTHPSQVGLIVMAFLESLQKGRNPAVALLKFRHELESMLDPRSPRRHDVLDIVDMHIELLDQPPYS